MLNGVFRQPESTFNKITTNYNPAKHRHKNTIKSLNFKIKLQKMAQKTVSGSLKKHLHHNEINKK